MTNPDSMALQTRQHGLIRSSVFQIAVATALLTVGVVLASIVFGASRTSSLPPAGPWYEYFLHNLTVLSAWSIGAVTFGTTTSIMAIYFIFVSGAAIGTANWEVAGPLLMHGVFELPAFGIGLWIGTIVPWMMLLVPNRSTAPSRTATRKSILLASMKWYLTACGLILVAGIVESAI